MSITAQLRLPGVEWIESPPPQLATGVELIGEFENSGLRAPTYLARRPDGQMLHLSRLLYLIAHHADGHHTHRHIAALVGGRIGRWLSPDDVRGLVDSKLIPAGIVAGGTQPNHMGRRADGILALSLRAAVLPEKVVNAVSLVLLPLFTPLVVVMVLVAIGLLDGWLLFQHSLAGAFRESMEQPRIILALLGLLVGSAAFHEFGHATACRYGGARPGHIGAGLYLIWPVFYSDVTDSYRLRRGGRLRTDLGGLYFNVIFMLVTAGVYAISHFEPLLLLIPLQHIEMAHQLFPFVRLDGYYLLSDLTGIPDLFSRLGPILKSLVPGRIPDPRVRALKPWARAIATAWVLIAVAALGSFYVVVLSGAAHILGALRTSMIAQSKLAVSAAGHHDLAVAALAVLGMLGAVLPVLALGWTLVLLGKALLQWGFRIRNRRVLARVALPVAAAAAAGFVVGLSWSQAHLSSASSNRVLLPVLGAGGTHALRHAPQTQQPLSVPARVVLTESARAAPSSVASATPAASATPTATPEPSPSPTPSPTPSPSPSPTGSPSPSPTGSPSPSPTGSPSPSPSPSVSGV